MNVTGRIDLNPVAAIRVVRGVRQRRYSDDKDAIGSQASSGSLKLDVEVDDVLEGMMIHDDVEFLTQIAKGSLDETNSVPPEENWR